MKIVVLGAGISGLTFASNCVNHDVCVIEKNPYIGGLASTYSVDTAVGVFRFDIGGHWFHYHNAPEIFKFVDAGSGIYIKRQSSVFIHDDIIPFPIQNNYKTMSNKSLVDKINKDYSRLGKEDTSNYENMLLTRYGNTLCEEFFFPYNKKMYGLQKLTELRVGGMQLRMNVARGQSGYNDKFMYFQSGIHEIIEGMSKNVNVNLNTEVVEIFLEEHVIRTSLGDSIKYDALVSSIPLKDMLGFVDNKYLNDCADDLTSSPGMIINVGCRQKLNNLNKNWTYYPDMELPFYRVGNYSSVSPEMAPTGYNSLYVEVSPLAFRDMELGDLEHRVWQGLIKTGWIDKHDDIVTSSMVPLKYNYCFFNDQLPEIQSQLESYQVYTIGRYGTWRWSSMHDDFLDALSLAEQFSGDNHNKE